jgi:hypothetical protein
MAGGLHGRPGRLSGGEPDFNFNAAAAGGALVLAILVAVFTVVTRIVRWQPRQLPAVAAQ